jgi:hypothetical protein
VAAPSDPHAYLGTTRCNLLGTCITVHDWGMAVDAHAARADDGGGGGGGGAAAGPAARPIPNIALMMAAGADVGAGPAGPLLGHPCGFLPSLGQRELARIHYDSNILASAPNRMTVELRHHDDYDRLDMLRAKALGKDGRPQGSGGGGGGGASDVSLSRAALYGLPVDAVTHAAGSVLALARRGAGGAGGEASPPDSLASSILQMIPTFSGPLASPADVDLRVCTPSSGFGLGLGSAAGVGSWAGLLQAAWTQVVGAGDGGGGEAAAAAAAGLRGVDAAARLASRSPASPASAAAAADVTAAARALPGADAVAPYALLMTRRPRWSDRMDAWTMDFRGRVLRASKKNFQLVAVPLAHRDDADAYTGDHASAPALLFGKVAKDRYSLDFSPGCLGPVQAFAVALSTFASKLAVA